MQKVKLLFKNLLEQINLAKMAGYKACTKKLFTFLFTKTQSSEKIKKTTPLLLASKTTKYLGINLTKKAKDFCVKTIQT